MKLNEKVLLFSFVTLATAATAPAFARDAHPNYIGISAGEATVEDFCGDGESSCDDGASTFRIHTGAEVNNFVNFELGYRYIDDVEASGAINSVGVTAAVTGHFVDTTFQLGMPESGPFRIFSKAGLQFWRLKVDVAASNGVQTLSGSDSHTGVGFRTGLGMSYEVSERLRLRADWDFLVNIGDEDEIGETDINVFSAGPEFRF